ncbi:unnamed protein product [Ambrosiozyma monospora]|uniref:Unnamed protein product n=1 Tax=Ambrosiozyma monospora TaxID=43982 RepID=A0ACB5SSG4_AMBMO|nr:unnamed protein product [Ambrosiozyma monospora]
MCSPFSSSPSYSTITNTTTHNTDTKLSYPILKMDPFSRDADPEITSTQHTLTPTPSLPLLSIDENDAVTHTEPESEIQIGTHIRQSTSNKFSKLPWYRKPSLFNVCLYLLLFQFSANFSSAAQLELVITGLCRDALNSKDRFTVEDQDQSNPNHLFSYKIKEIEALEMTCNTSDVQLASLSIQKWCSFIPGLISLFVLIPIYMLNTRRNTKTQAKTKAKAKTKKMTKANCLGSKQMLMFALTFIVISQLSINTALSQPTWLMFGDNHFKPLLIILASSISGLGGGGQICTLVYICYIYAKEVVSLNEDNEKETNNTDGDEILTKQRQNPQYKDMEIIGALLGTLYLGVGGGQMIASLLKIESVYVLIISCVLCAFSLILCCLLLPNPKLMKSRVGGDSDSVANVESLSSEIITINHLAKQDLEVDLENGELLFLDSDTDNTTLDDIYDNNNGESADDQGPASNEINDTTTKPTTNNINQSLWSSISGLFWITKYDKRGRLDHKVKRNTSILFLMNILFISADIGSIYCLVLYGTFKFHWDQHEIGKIISVLMFSKSVAYWLKINSQNQNQILNLNQLLSLLNGKFNKSFKLIKHFNRLDLIDLCYLYGCFLFEILAMLCVISTHSITGFYTSSFRIQSYDKYND